MVFVVKLPARRGGGPPASAEASEGQVQRPMQPTQEETPATPTALPPVGLLSLAPAPTQTVTVEGAVGTSTIPPATWDMAPSPPKNTAAPSKPTQCALDVLLAPSVLAHQYVRGVDKSSIVERPERIRAVMLGVAAVHGLWDTYPTGPKAETPDDLAAMLSGMSMDTEQPAPALRVLTTSRSVPLDASNPAVRAVHAHPDDPALYSVTTAYAGETEPVSPAHISRLAQLGAMAPHQPPGSSARVAKAPLTSSDASSSDGEGDERIFASEIPAELPQGDLYLCGPHAAGASDEHDGGSREAICHALGASIEAVDRVVAASAATPPTWISPEVGPIRSSSLAPPSGPQPTAHIPAKRAFVLTRPPGHHCAGADPQGFCWVNNVAVAAAHAHAQHGIDRVIVLDIDLHHGNGTQSLAWRMNAEAVRMDAARALHLQMHRRTTRTRAVRSADPAALYTQYLEDEAVAGPRALRMCYTSLHDIESFPCEDGDPTLVCNASVCVEGAHGQWIWNGTYLWPGDWTRS